MLKKYLIFRCLFCGTIQYMRSSQKSKLCPNCGKINRVNKIRIISTVEDAELALKTVLKLKQKKNSKEFYKASELMDVK
ncbi:MAG: DUF1922 domain-containing protein [Candidatus Odinarchaeia archaeon]